MKHFHAVSCRQLYYYITSLQKKQVLFRNIWNLKNLCYYSFAFEEIPFFPSELAADFFDFK